MWTTWAASIRLALRGQHRAWLRPELAAERLRVPDASSGQNGSVPLTE